MELHGHNITGDGEGLSYLASNASALQQLIDEARANGRAEFHYLDKRFIILPTASGAFSVSETHNRTFSGGLGRVKSFLGGG